MRFPLYRVVAAFLCLSAPSWAVKVEVPAGEPRAGNGIAAGTVGGVQAVQLRVPTLDQSLSLAAAPSPRLDLTPAIALNPAPALPSADAGPLPAPLAPSAIEADAAPVDGTGAGSDEAGLAPAESGGLDGQARAGDVRFDGAAGGKGSGGLLAALKRLIPFAGDIVPSWPGRAGETVRLGGKTFKLDRVIGSGDGYTVWGVSGGRGYAVKILHPEAASLPRHGRELSVLRAVRDAADIPHARLLAAGKDGRVRVMERFDGETAATLLDRGGFRRWQADAWADLAAGLIRAGVTAELAPANLQYAHYRHRWALLDAGGAREGAPREVLSQLLAPPLVERAGLDAADVLSALRGRLGVDSRLWERTARDIRAVPHLAAALARLQAADAARPAPPPLVFGPGPARASPFDDSVVAPGEVVKRLGFDPWRSKNRFRFTHDKGKLNTELYAVDEPGKPRLFLKRADWWMIQRELAVRRLVSRLFGTWFDVPHALAVNLGRESYLVMERAEGSPAYGRTPLTLERRVALGVLANAFGFYDLNPGNILYPARKGGRPVLLDFEQALGRRSPVPGRLPDEGMLLEMPWLDGHARNHAADYHHGARAWRAKLADPATARDLRSDLLAAGYARAQADAILETVAANAAELDATLQADVEFANGFVEKRVTP